MFVRKNRNRSGSVSIQVVSKTHGFYKVIKTFGSASGSEEIDELVRQAKQFIHSPENQLGLFNDLSFEDRITKQIIDSLKNSQMKTVGPELIFGTLFDRIGFGGVVKGQMFRDLVIARLAYPTSKLKTVDYLYRYRGIQTHVDTIYRFLDHFHKSYKNKVEQVAYEYTKDLLKRIDVVFYDMTTLYFEAEDEDDLRKIGFSKDGKFQKPQIMLGLLVGTGGYPIGYDVFEGNTFEGHTLLPTLRKIEKKYGFKNATVIADAALLSKDNLKNLSNAQYQFIVGARIKNESQSIQEEILKKAADGMEDGDSFFINKKDGLRLLISYSIKRAKKDAHNRTRGLRKLQKRIKSGRLTKENINNRGYNKFLKLQGEITVSIDEEKVVQDAKWDGLKGYVTNTRLSPKEIIENYKELWQIEKAFRISKTDLKIRPIYHYRKNRIEAHICLSFVAYTIFKELERLLKMAHVNISPKRASELTHNMYQITAMLPSSKKEYSKTLIMDEDQDKLLNIIQ